MPVKDAQYWRERLPLADPCHYLNPSMDWYAGLVRRNGIRRVWPESVRPGDWVLDVGCGDGRMGAWMKKEFGVNVCGIDAFEYQGVIDRLDRFVHADAERLVDVLFYEQFDLAVAFTSLPFMSDWRFVVAQMAVLSKQVLIVENTQSPIPEWQKGLAQKAPFTLEQLCQSFAHWNFDLEDATAVNAVDRSWLSRAPTWAKWPVFLATALVDTYAYLFVPPNRARYTATLYRHEHYWTGRQ